jgi:hypothetical protein
MRAFLIGGPLDGFPISKRDVFLSFALGGLVAFEHYTFILISGGDMVDQNQVVKNLIFMFYEEQHISYYAPQTRGPVTESRLLLHLSRYR